MLGRKGRLFFLMMGLNITLLNAEALVKSGEEDIYEREQRYSCSCYAPHYCVQVGVYLEPKNLKKVQERLKDMEGIAFFTIENVTIEKREMQRLLVHAHQFFVSKEEAKALLKKVKKKVKDAFVVKRIFAE